MIFVFYNIYHIRYILLIYGKYHIKYDFMHIVCLSYLLRGFRHTDPETPGTGSVFSGPWLRRLLTQYLVEKFTTIHTTCGIFALPCDTSPGARKDRFAYFLTMLYFRKVPNMQ